MRVEAIALRKVITCDHLLRYRRCCPRAASTWPAPADGRAPHPAPPLLRAAARGWAPTRGRACKSAGSRSAPSSPDIHIELIHVPLTWPTCRCRRASGRPRATRRALLRGRAAAACRRGGRGARGEARLSRVVRMARVAPVARVACVAWRAWRLTTQSTQW